MTNEYPLSDHDGPSRREYHLNKRVSQLVAMALIADLALFFAEFIIGLNPFLELEKHPLFNLAALVLTVSVFGVYGYVIGSREAKLEEMALRDALTGLFNSRYLHARLREELELAKRHQWTTAFVLFDIDFFKKVNDEHGHPVGDKLLQCVGKGILSTLRTGEIAARVGGEEFALLLPATSLDEAIIAAKRMREAMGAVNVVLASGESLMVTASAGLVLSSKGDAMGAQALYSQADQALYRAKKRGRDRLIVW